ncbi:MAG: HAMP domain-containing sensor histidine kinase [Chitinophagaceae bacterium]
MTFLQQQLFQAQEKIKIVNTLRLTGLLKEQLAAGWKQKLGAAISREIADCKKQLLDFHHLVKSIGSSAVLDDYEKRKLGIFNQLNFFQIVAGICMPVTGLFHNTRFPEWAWLVATLPACISIIVLWLNAKHKYEAAIIFYFISYPVVTSFVYMSGIHVGVELFFILYGILSVFFLQSISHMLFSISFNMVSYFMLAVVWSAHRFQLEADNMVLYLFNQFAGIVFIFFGLFLIKKENMGYQLSILAKNEEIAKNAVLLEEQTIELTELNNVKNKLFSIIAHDLKTPMYSLRNLFMMIQKQGLPAKQIKDMLPDMINNLNYTTGLMENLLQWAKCQMQSAGINIQKLDITGMVREVTQLMQLQAAAKQLVIECEMSAPVYVMADKNMIDLVLRNLLSNAIKFTPEKGSIVIGTASMSSFVELYITDTGRGISPEAMQKINGSDYYSTNGTAHEPGTGLGLMLCKEFLTKNGSHLLIESAPAKGSRFSFSLPIAI